MLFVVLGLLAQCLLISVAAEMFLLAYGLANGRPNAFSHIGLL